MLSYGCGVADLSCNRSASSTTTITKSSDRLISTTTGDSTRYDDQPMSLFTQDESTIRSSQLSSFVDHWRNSITQHHVGKSTSRHRKFRRAGWQTR